jgi:hypothetical protein
MSAKNLCLMCAVWGCIAVLKDHILCQTVSVSHWSRRMTTARSSRNGGLYMVVRNSQIMSTVTALLNLCQDGMNKSMFLRIRINYYYYCCCWNKCFTFHADHLMLCIRNYNETISDVFGNILQVWFLKQDFLNRYGQKCVIILQFCTEIDICLTRLLLNIVQSAFHDFYHQTTSLKANNSKYSGS